MKFGNGACVGTGTGGEISVGELDGSPTGSGITSILFNSDCTDCLQVTIDGTTAIIGAPPNAPTLDSTTLALSGANLVTGRLSQSNINYSGTDPAGSLVSYITNDTIFLLATQTDSNFGDLGILEVYVNNEKVAAIDLASNFNEANRSASQNLADYDTDYNDGATNFPLTNGVCDFVGTYAGAGSLQLTKVEQYNSFDNWQAWAANINVTSQIRQGWSNIRIEHNDITGQSNQVSNSFEFFYDNDAGANPSVNTPTVVEGTPAYKWLSGVRYYGGGSEFLVSVTGSALFNNVYHSTNQPIVLSNWPGISSIGIPYTDVAVSGVSTPPDIGETMTVTDFDFTQPTNQYSDNAILTATPRDPYGSYSSANSVSGAWLIFSWTDGSDDLHEYFRDENYRLLYNETTNDHDSPPATKTGNWDSTEDLRFYDTPTKHGQFWQRRFKYPDTDFSTGFKPTGNPDYSSFVGMTAPSFSGFAGDVVLFCRGFYDDGDEHTNGRLYIGGITGANISNGDIEVFIKVPGKTGWTSLNVEYNFATYTGADGDGCRTNVVTYNGPEFEFTLGTNATDATTNYGIIVLVVANNSSPDIVNSMYIVDW